MVARQSLTLLALFVLVFLFPANVFCEENSFEKGAELYKSGRFQEAITQFRKSYQLGLSKPNSLYYIAMCQQQLGDLMEARDSYKFVCTRYPNSAVFDRALKMLKEIESNLAERSEKPLKLPVEPSRESAGAIPRPKSDTYIVRFTMESDNRIYLDGTINGTKTKILFDTGAGVTFCRQSFIDRAGMKQLNWISESAIIPGAMGEAPAKVAVVKIAVGNMVRESKIYVEQDRPESYYPALDNVPIVGQSFFGDMSYQVDGRMNVIVFKKVAVSRGPVKPGRLGPGEVPFTRDGSHIVVKAKVNDRECDMIFDTGASQVVFADRHLAQCGLNRPVDATNSIRKGTGSARDSYAFKIDRITLGPIERQDVNVAVLVNTKFSRPLLGQAFLEGLVYTVDPVRNVIRFETLN